MIVERYTPERQAEWDEFIRGSKNGTFLFQRAYMDYHSDRFHDHSLLVHDGKGVLAVLPAHQRETSLVSHDGLTYGGFVSGSRMTLIAMQACFDAVGHYLLGRSFQTLMYKTVPHIYHRLPAEEDVHALFLRNATMHRRDVLAVIDRERRGPVQERRSRAVKKAAKTGMAVRESAEYGPFWDILSQNLQSKYACRPVHSLEEISLLARRFPENIRLVCCYAGDAVAAGVVCYVSDRVMHLQYIASTEEGSAAGALDLLMETVITQSKQRFFDFGAATERDGRYVNAGLMEFKEGFGARTIVHDFYTLPLEGVPLVGRS